MNAKHRLHTASAATLIALWSGSASAADLWTAVIAAEGMTSYAAPDTILPHSGIKSMWELRDHKDKDGRSPNGKTFASVLRRVEYDCTNEKLVVLSETFFKGRMSAGELVDSAGISVEKANEWLAIKPDTVEAAMMSVACAEPGALNLGALRRFIARMVSIVMPGPETGPAPALAQGKQ